MLLPVFSMEEELYMSAMLVSLVILSVLLGHIDRAFSFWEEMFDIGSH